MMGMLPLAAQNKRWSVDAADILPGAKASLLHVQVNPSDTAWILLQTTTTAKLVRAGGTGGNVKVFDLPVRANADYTFRISEENKCIVQAGRKVSKLALRDQKDPVTKKRIKVWVQQDIVLPEDEDEDGFNVGYDAEAQRTGQHIWYFTSNDAGEVQQVIMRTAP